MPKIDNGQVVDLLDLATIIGQRVRIPDPERLVHLQFRRFAGCPICNLHLRSITRRHDDIVAAGIREVAVFHSTAVDMHQYQSDLPFDAVADPDRRLYARFGVDASPWAVLHPRTWLAALRGVAAGSAARPAHGETALGLPADFLIDTDGRVLAHKYGHHADDQWSVDDLLRLAHHGW
ncbi:peroxiredoxin-like family protein [Micromonospora sp. C95]|uniref:peroxiredoxin-like family protein n=1 Tax=Micromonospora sp. C95 TaxID=2824882 RepID=UPI001B3783B2|nr:peroxiredoxin-like family protein [Micromonospora sp. C95]MBQ1027538.1 AhpC/TSA family protein [Micromonospora sp. C95]